MIETRLNCKYCNNENLNIETDLVGIHWGKVTCYNCGRFIRWLPKCKIPDVSVVRLLHSGAGLEPWQREFLKIVVSRNRSKAEEIVVQAIAEKVNPATVGRGTG